LEITASLVKELREKTGVGMMDCKKALTESEGDIERAVEYLRKKGIATAQKRAGRSTSEGQVQAYIHAGGKIGVLVEVNCETDFSAKTDDFSQFVKDVAMPLVTLIPEESLYSALIKFLRSGYTQIPVVSKGDPDRIMGYLRHEDLMMAYNKEILRRKTESPDVTKI